MRSLFIDPGRFRHELILESCERIADGIGGHAETWAEVGVVMGHLEPQPQRLTGAADQDIAVARFRVTIRRRPDVAAGMRLSRGIRHFRIETVTDPDESGRYLVCQVKEEEE